MTTDNKQKELRQSQIGFYNPKTKELRMRLVSHEMNKDEEKPKENIGLYDKKTKTATVKCRKYNFNFKCPVDITEESVKWKYNQCWLIIEGIENPDPAKYLEKVPSAKTKKSTKDAAPEKTPAKPPVSTEKNTSKKAKPKAKKK